MGEKTAESVGADQVAIWCPADRLGEFITGLLGKPQTIQRLLPGNFLVRRDDLLGLHHLIEQRVHDQNEAEVIQFVASVRYQGGLSVEIGSIAEFASYAEVRALQTNSVALSWVYLINFKGRRTPERQQIEVIFIRRGDRNTREILESYVPEMSGAGLKYPESSSGFILIKISHTMRSWGIDLEGLLSDHLAVFLGQKKTGLPRLMDTCATAMGFITFGAVSSVMLLLGIYLLRRATSNYKLGGYSPSTPLPEAVAVIGQKMDALYSFIGGGHGVSLTIASLAYAVLSLIMAGVLGGTVGVAAGDTYPSFIIFTRSDEQFWQYTLRRLRQGWRQTAIGFCPGVAGGIAANIITYYVW
jgi:hypothetical protein